MIKNRRKISVGVQMPADLWARFKGLVGETGASLNYCLERVIYDVVSQGAIPGVRPLESHEARENAKYGPSTPTYDGNTEPQPKASQSDRKRRAESV